MDLLARILKHPDAPRWNRSIVDDITTEEIALVKNFEAQLTSLREPFAQQLPLKIWNWIKLHRKWSKHFQQSVPISNYVDLNWEAIPTMSRQDIAIHLDKVVPLNADLKKLFYYNTSGTTGHVLKVPNNVVAVASYFPLIKYALQKWGISLNLSPDCIASFLIGAQRQTVTYALISKILYGSCIAKLNIRAEEWPDDKSANRFISEFNPQLLTGDPISFAEMLRQNIECSPKAMLTTAVAMPSGLKRKLQEHYHCPIIDWYSLTETGPIGYYCPHGHGYHILPHDIFIEVIDQQGKQVKSGERGEIAITGGRNPFLPLLRYCTGDWGSINYEPCACGDLMPRLETLEGRTPVLFQHQDGHQVNPIDISQILQKYPIVQYEFQQLSNGCCEVTIRNISEQYPIHKEMIRQQLQEILGNLEIVINIDPNLGEHHVSDKVIPYRSELLLDD